MVLPGRGQQDCPVVARYSARRGQWARGREPRGWARSVPGRRHLSRALVDTAVQASPPSNSIDVIVAGRWWRRS